MADPSPHMCRYERLDGGRSAAAAWYRRELVDRHHRTPHRVQCCSDEHAADRLESAGIVL
jgi:hypothetical protein